MEVTRKPLAKIEGRKRMQASGLTVSWHGTRRLKDWVAYLEDASDDARLVLAQQVSERAVKSLLARIQTLSRDDLRAMGRPVGAVAQYGGGPPERGTSDGSAGSSGDLAAFSASSPQLMLTGNADGQGAERPRRHRMAAVGTGTGEARRPARPSSRDVAGTLRQLRSRIETLESEQEHLRAELAVLRGEADGYEGTPSIFVTGWFRATLVLIVLAIVVVITVPWLMDVFDGGAREASPPVRTESTAPTTR